MNLHDLIQQAAATWSAQERANAQSLPGQVMQRIEMVGKLRQPQREAIAVYLWLKFVGRNMSLGHHIRNGLLSDVIPDDARLDGNPLRNFLHYFAESNELKELASQLLKDWHGKEIQWSGFLDDLLHNFSYPLYLHSLPMGAGKTYLMAAVIYLDLHFARLHLGDPRFARNFVVFAPSASKTAHPFTATRSTATVGKKGLANEITSRGGVENQNFHFTYSAFLDQLVKAAWGCFSHAELVEAHDAALRAIHSEFTNS